MTMLVTWTSSLRSIAACVIALVLSPPYAQAQKPARGQGTPLDQTMRRQERRDAKREIRREMKGKPPDGPARDGELRPGRPQGRGAVIGRALGLLSLTPEQRRSMRQIRARTDERMRQHGRRVLDLRRDIDASLFGPTLSMDVARAKSRELATIIGERTTERTLVELAVFEILTPAQRAEIRAIRDEQRSRVREELRDRRADTQARPQDSPHEPPGPPPDARPDATNPDGEFDDEPAEPEGSPEPGGRMKPQRPGGMPELLADLNVTPEQLRRLRQLRRQQAARTRRTAMQFRDLQARIDDQLLAETIDSAQVKDLAAQLGRADAERELVRFESEAGIREILTLQQAEAFRERRRRQWVDGRGGGPEPPEDAAEPPPMR